MRYYKLNNLYYSYNDLHNTYGYTYTPTQEIGYLTILPWGGSTQVIEGFRVNTNVYSESDYFVINEIGWVGLNNLAWDKGYFPDDVENTVLSRNGETSNVVFLQFEDEPRYLIEKDLSAGWITEQEYIQRGWSESSLYLTGILTYTEDSELVKVQTDSNLNIDQDFTKVLSVGYLPSIEKINIDNIHIPLFDGYLPNLNKLSIDNTFIHSGLAQGYLPEQGVIEEYNPPTFVEIEVWGDVSTDTSCQDNITNSFSGNVTSSKTLQLYTDSSKTVPFVYDYSNNYEVGWTSSVDGSWVRIDTDVSEMPSTTADRTMGDTVTCKCVLLDTGCLWFICNNSNSVYSYTQEHASFFGHVFIRAYPKGEKIFPIYTFGSYGSGIYDNNTINSSGRNMSWTRGWNNPSTYCGTHLPTMIPKAIYQSGNILRDDLLPYLNLFVSNGNLRASSTSVQNDISCSCVTFTFNETIYVGWFSPSKINVTSLRTETKYTLYDDNGDPILYESGYTYTPLVIFESSGLSSLNMYIDSNQYVEEDGNGNLSYRYTSSSISRVAYLWYLKTPV